MRDPKISGPRSALLAASILPAVAIAGVLLSRPLQAPLAMVGFAIALLALRVGVMAEAIAGDSTR